MPKGPSKHTKPHAVEYRVAWDQERGRFNVLREAERTASFSRQQGTAVGLAIREAQREAAESGKKIIVTSMRNGKRIMEWDGITPL
ncbi:MAG: hypothetical protein V4527_01810 [Pseudomonadota bacterium]